MTPSNFDCLLAKSYPGCAAGTQAPAYARLLPHLRAVESAGESIVKAVGELILQQLALPSDVWLSRLRRGNDRSKHPIIVSVQLVENERSDENCRRIVQATPVVAH